MKIVLLLNEVNAFDALKHVKDFNGMFFTESCRNHVCILL